jgi:hypothetical protein
MKENGRKCEQSVEIFLWGVKFWQIIQRSNPLCTSAVLSSEEGAKTSFALIMDAPKQDFMEQEFRIRGSGSSICICIFPVLHGCSWHGMMEVVISNS